MEADQDLPRLRAQLARLADDCVDEGLLREIKRILLRSDDGRDDLTRIRRGTERILGELCRIYGLKSAGSLQERKERLRGKTDDKVENWVQTVQQYCNPAAHDTEEEPDDASLKIALSAFVYLVEWFAAQKIQPIAAAPGGPWSQARSFKSSRWPYLFLATVSGIVLIAGAWISIEAIAILTGAGGRLRVAGGSPTMSFGQAAESLQLPLSKDFVVDLRVTPGAAENLDLLCQGNADVGLTYVHLPPPCAGLQAIGRVFDVAMHLVVRADSPIKDASDIGPGTRVGVGPSGSGTAEHERAF